MLSLCGWDVQQLQHLFIALEYLDGVPSNIPQAMNSRGILAMEEGRYQDAMQLFQAAEQAGVGEATQNIALLKQLVAAENQ